jgi:hypothetical protein
MAALVVAYWIGDMSRDMYAPYTSPGLVPVDSAEIVMSQTEAASVFLLLRGTMTEYCGDVGSPVVAQAGEHAFLRVALENQRPCAEPTAYEVRLPLSSSFRDLEPRFVTVNEHVFEVGPWERVAAASRFAYDSNTYADYSAPEPEVVDKAPLVVSIDSLAGADEAQLEVDYSEQPINFAGRFVVLEGRCDTDLIPELGCWRYVIIDSLSGRTVQSLEYEGYPAGYQADSLLFVINDPLRSSIETPEEVQFFVMEDGTLPSLRQIATGAATAYTTSTTSPEE